MQCTSCASPSMSRQHAMDHDNKYAIEKSTTDTEGKQDSFVVHFFPYGNGFSAARRQKLKENFERMGATIVEDLWKATYIVLSESIRSLDVVAKRLKVSETRLRQHLDNNPVAVRCVLPSWADHCVRKRSLEVPSRMHICYHLSPTPKSTSDRTPMKRKQEQGKISDETMVDLFGRKETNSEDGDSDSKTATTRKQSFPQNVKAAEAFKTLSRLHQSMPLLPGDQWKSYCFRIVAGRLLELDFEIDNDESTQQKLRAIKGFGKSVCDKIQEVIDHGTISRIEEFRSDKQRQTMKNITDIWGVGPVKARDLIARGYETIEDIRKGLRQNKLSSLDRNQLVGVDCYEDILDRMSRSEVEQIGEMVQRVANKLFPGIEGGIMGSYRRGQDNCGDVDILLCHPDHVDTIPNFALGQIIDALWNEGKVAMHLTFLSGMTTGSHSNDYSNASRYVPREVWERAKVKPTSQVEHKFYMGCLYSPTKHGVRRRVDIKFYPYRERAFATLYFTGNGYFNRSMRLWATRMFNLKLSDHGLFDRNDGTTRMFEASTERQIFDRLELVYREVHERHHWDALEPINKVIETDLKLTKPEFDDDRKHQWIE